MTVVGFLRADLSRDDLRRLALRLASEGYAVLERRFAGPAAPTGDLADSLAALNDLEARRLVLWFHAPRGVLMKRLRSAPVQEVVAPLFEPGFEWTYRHEKDRVTVEIRYGEGAPAEGLGDRAAGFHEVLARVDRKALMRWVEKFANRAGR